MLAQVYLANGSEAEVSRQTAKKTSRPRATNESKASHSGIEREEDFWINFCYHCSKASNLGIEREEISLDLSLLLLDNDCDCERRTCGRRREKSTISLQRK